MTYQYYTTHRRGTTYPTDCGESLRGCILPVGPYTVDLRRILSQQGVHIIDQLGVTDRLTDDGSAVSAKAGPSPSSGRAVSANAVPLPLTSGPAVSAKAVPSPSTSEFDQYGFAVSAKAVPPPIWVCGISESCAIPIDRVRVLSTDWNRTADSCT